MHQALRKNEGSRQGRQRSTDPHPARTRYASFRWPRRRTCDGRRDDATRTSRLLQWLPLQPRVRRSRTASREPCPRSVSGHPSICRRHARLSVESPPASRRLLCKSAGHDPRSRRFRRPYDNGCGASTADPRVGRYLPRRPVEVAIVMHRATVPRHRGQPRVRHNRSARAQHDFSSLGDPLDSCVASTLRTGQAPRDKRIPDRRGRFAQILVRACAPG